MQLTPLSKLGSRWKRVIWRRHGGSYMDGIVQQETGHLYHQMMGQQTNVRVELYGNVIGASFSGFPLTSI